MAEYAQTPTSAPPPGADAKRIVKRLTQLQALRLPHEGDWRDCLDVSFPIRGSGFSQSNISSQQARDKRARAVDSTATDACKILASSLQAGMTPANATWFGLQVPGSDSLGEGWLEDASKQLHQEIHNANYDSEALDAMLDVVACGWFVMFIDSDEHGLVYNAWPIGGCFVASTRADRAVDTVYRRYTLTAEQCVSEFGADNVSELTRKNAVEEPDSPVDLVHAIYPRKLSAVGGKLAKNMPFASCHVEINAIKLVKESGYPEFPCVVPRWSLIPDTSYAVGPLFDALPDVNQLNELKRLDYASADIAIAGMWIAKDDGVLNPRTIKVGARKVIVAGDVDSMKPLMTGADWQLADTRIAQLQSSIRKLLMADQLQPQDGPAMTATEIHARIALIRQQLGPTFGRMQAEYLQGVVIRSFMLAYRAGIFPPPPPSVVQRPLFVKFKGPLARAQQLEDVSAIQNTLAAMLPIAELRPEVFDTYDLDDMARKVAEGQGVPHTGIRDADMVKQIRDARSQQQQATAQQEHVQQIQQIAAQAASQGAQDRATAAA